MQQRTFFLCLLLILPSLFMGQVLQETNQGSNGLPDPDAYPFGFHFKLGIPTASMTVETGHRAIRQVFEEEGIEFPDIRTMNIFELGLRYKRFYLDFGTAGLLLNSPIPPFVNDRFSIQSFHTLVWLNAGVSVWQNRNSALMLRLGIGGNAISYQIRSLQNANQVDFENLFAEQGANSSTTLYIEEAFLDVGIEWWIGRPKSRTSFGETVRLGYRRGALETAWEVLDAPFTNPLLDRMGEIYMQACFHLGYNFPQKSK